MFCLCSNITSKEGGDSEGRGKTNEIFLCGPVKADKTENSRKDQNSGKQIESHNLRIAD
ncbi:hypothetical protein J6590_015370 [Homalodisca vitripennis]|nr:hypothetical protein J6590_015370 [Homalodisca vitripennis]